MEAGHSVLILNQLSWREMMPVCLQRGFTGRARARMGW